MHASGSETLVKAMEQRLDNAANQEVQLLEEQVRLLDIDVVASAASAASAPPLLLLLMIFVMLQHPAHALESAPKTGEAASLESMPRIAECLENASDLFIMCVLVIISATMNDENPNIWKCFVCDQHLDSIKEVTKTHFREKHPDKKATYNEKVKGKNLGHFVLNGRISTGVCGPLSVP